MAIIADQRPILLFGAGGFAAEVVDLIAAIGGRQVAGCVVDVSDPPPVPGLENLPIHQLDRIGAQAASYTAVMALGNAERPVFLSKAEALGFRFETLIHPQAAIALSAVIGTGSVILAGTVVGAQARLGRLTLINRGATVGHHAMLGDCVNLGPGATIGSFAAIGDRTSIGIGATVIDRIAIGADCVVGAGALVTRDFEPSRKILGYPARAVAR